MAYGSHGFYPFHLGVFHVKIVCLIVVDLLLLGFLCCFASFFIEPILHIKREKSFLESFI